MSSTYFFRLALSLGYQDVQRTYQRSALGPIWNVIGLAAQLLTIGTIFGIVFRTDLGTYFPFLSISLIVWSNFASTINESTGIFLAADRIIKQVSLPYYFPIVRLLSKNSIFLLHNFSIFLVVATVYPQDWDWHVLLLLPGLMVLLGNLVWISTLAAFVSTRFRDFPPAIAALLTVSFYATPVLWMPDSLPAGFRELIVTYNPFYHLMELVRGPLLGNAPLLENWLVGLGILVAGNTLAWLVARKFWWRVAYWL
jgi:ABC-type polysaccharide/polyol phosphate export permease